MRVICIDDSGMHKLIHYGEEYTVCEETDKYYRLTEIYINPFTGDKCGFYKKRFIPLSEIDETEFERNYQKETV